MKTKHGESRASARLDEGSNPSGSTKKSHTFKCGFLFESLVSKSYSLTTLTECDPVSENTFKM